MLAHFIGFAIKRKTFWAGCPETSDTKSATFGCILFAANKSRNHRVAYSEPENKSSRCASATPGEIARSTINVRIWFAMLLSVSYASSTGGPIDNIGHEKDSRKACSMFLAGNYLFFQRVNQFLILCTQLSIGDFQQIPILAQQDHRFAFHPLELCLHFEATSRVAPLSHL